MCQSAGGRIESGIHNKYASEDVMVLGIECWNGDQSQVQIFKNKTNPMATYPLLTQGSAVQNSYETDYDWSIVIDQQGLVQYSDKNADVNAINNTIDQLLLSDIQTGSKHPQKFTLAQNYPNPFNPTTAISYQLSAVSDVELTVYNMLGQKVRTLVNRRQPAGTYTVNFSGKDFTSGHYFYKLDNGSESIIRKMTLVR